MRALIINLFSIAIISLFSCVEKKRTPGHQGNNDIPVALQENKKSSLLEIKKRAPEDIIDELYAELKKEDTSLEQFSAKIVKLREQKQDSAKNFQNFQGKNEDYYHSARLHHNKIGDSALSAQVGLLIETSLKEYDRRAAIHTGLLELLEKRKSILDDWEEAVKIITTISMMEKYQQGNFPSPSSLEALLKEYDNAIRQAHILTKK